MLQNLLLYHNSTGQQEKSGSWCTDWSTQFINTNNGKYHTYAWTLYKKGNQSSIFTNNHSCVMIAPAGSNLSRTTQIR